MVLYDLISMAGVTWIHGSLPIFLGKKTGTLKLERIRKTLSALNS